MPMNGVTISLGHLRLGEARVRQPRSVSQPASTKSGERCSFPIYRFGVRNTWSRVREATLQDHLRLCARHIRDRRYRRFRECPKPICKRPRQQKRVEFQHLLVVAPLPKGLNIPEINFLLGLCPFFQAFPKLLLNLCPFGKGRHTVNDHDALTGFVALTWATRNRSLPCFHQAASGKRLGTKAISWTTPTLQFSNWPFLIVRKASIPARAALEFCRAANRKSIS